MIKFETVIPVFLIIFILSFMFIPGSVIEAEDNEQLEIFSWWTATGEAEGLNYLIENFELNYPGLSVINSAIHGGAGVNAKEVVKIRILQGDPPDIFQVHGGSELQDTWIAGGYLQPLTALWEEERWKESYPETIKDMVKYNDEFYALPVTIHRSNRLWYNKDIFEKHDLVIPESTEELIDTSKELSDLGIVPLALSSQNKWPISHIFEIILFEEAGQEKYYKLISGKLSWENDSVKSSLKKLEDLFKYVNEDHAALTWSEAAEMVLTEKAAMTIMGTWAGGYYYSRDSVENKDYETIPFPGEAEFFGLVIDTFALPEDITNQIEAEKWLKFVSKPEIQHDFTSLMGALPARMNISHHDLRPYLQQDRIDLENQTIIPSITHGTATREVFISSLNDELNQFLYTNDINATLERLNEIAELFL